MKLIHERLGIHPFINKLEMILTSQYHAKALQTPQLKLSNSNDMVLDYEFARLYENLVSSILRILTGHDINIGDNVFRTPMPTHPNEQQISKIKDKNGLLNK